MSHRASIQPTRATAKPWALALGPILTLLTPTLAAPPTTAPHNTPETLRSSPTLHVTFGPEILVLPGGLQPSMLCTRAGTLIVQAQVPRKPAPSTRITYPSALDTVVSRDSGQTWTPFTMPPAAVNLDLEGGIFQLHDGLILAYDTYVIPGAQPDQGVGLLFTSTDDFHTLQGPTDALFSLPNIQFTGSTDDGGRPQAAQRLHRRILQLPSGDLLTTLYGWQNGDHAPCPYRPSMLKTRVMTLRSHDQGRHWQLLSTVAADPNVGTEGFGEAVLCRTSQGPNPSHLLCLMRTGRELYQATSEDLGATWSKPTPLVFADLDVYRTDLWVDHFRNLKDFHGKPLDENSPDELRGAVVDPDLIELKSGLLVATFGVRLPQKLCWRYPDHPWNGNYLAISPDHGQSWPHVIRLTSATLTTHYTAIEETPTPNHLYLTYDLGGWSKGMPRNIYGRTVAISTSSN